MIATLDEIGDLVLSQTPSDSPVQPDPIGCKVEQAPDLARLGHWALSNMRGCLGVQYRRNPGVGDIIELGFPHTVTYEIASVDAFGVTIKKIWELA